MAIDLYTLKKRAVPVLDANGGRQTVYFLQLSVEHAPLHRFTPPGGRRHPPCGQGMEGVRGTPEARRSGRDWTAFPRRGPPIYSWQFPGRFHCFDHELPRPVSYLGDRELYGYRLRTVQEQDRIRDFETAGRIDKGSATVYKDFWSGKIFESGEEFLKYRRRIPRVGEDDGLASETGPSSTPARLTKILALIGFIENKGNRAFGGRPAVPGMPEGQGFSTRRCSPKRMKFAAFDPGVPCTNRSMP